MEQSLQKTPRLEVVDALRGFAVLAILLVHHAEHFIYPVYPENSPAWLQALDQGLNSVVFALFAGKAYAIFALLFGLTFFIQYSNQRKKGNDFGWRFLWRLLLLIVFATLNAVFFPAGDVLLLFVAVGWVLVLTRKWSDKAVLVTACLFLLQPIEWFHYVAGLINPAHQMPNLGVGAMYAEVGEQVKSGDFWAFVRCNIGLGQKASLMWAVEAGRFVQTGGLFLLGAYIGRKQLFLSTEKNFAFWTKVLITASLLFAPLFALKELVSNEYPALKPSLGTVLNMWQSLSFTAVITASFVLLYQSARFQKVVSDLRFYGRMSLTNYVSQSFIGALIYFPIGLNLAPRCGITLSFLIAVVVFFLQVAFSKWWLSTHRQGPLETLWHRWTWVGTEKEKPA